MKTLTLDCGSVIFLDDEDYDRISKFHWMVGGNGDVVYRNVSRLKNRSMATEIMGTRGIIYDHIDRNSFNNCKDNFRPCSESQNCMNRGKRAGTYSSKYKGVFFYKKSSRWRAQITVMGTIHYLGQFDSEILAAIAYNNAAIKLHKEFAVLNIL